MKLLIANDLHLETGYPKGLTQNDADILVLAGDLNNGGFDQARGFIEDMCKNFEYVIFVPGNHDYYYHAMHEVNRFWMELAHFELNNFIYMDEAIWVHDKYVFIGATLWTDINRNPLNTNKIVGALHDFRMIRGMNAEVYQNLFLKHRGFIEQNLKDFGGVYTPVVITHHAPHRNSIHPKYMVPPHCDYNDAFANDLDDILDTYDIKLWIHGHTHTNFDYEVYGTRVVCNPLGYGKENPEFRNDLILEI